VSFSQLPEVAGDAYDEYTGSVIALSRAVEELRDVLKAEVRSLTTDSKGK